MKKFFFSLLFSGIFVFSAIAQPCVINLEMAGVDIVSSSETGNNCFIKFNFSFNLEANDGNKRIFIHLWNCNNYPTTPIDYSGKGPKAPALAASLGTIGIQNFGNDKLLFDEYSPDPAVNILFAGLTLSIDPVPEQPSFSRYTISGLEFTFPGECSDIACITGDAWAAQAQGADPSVSCSLQGFSALLNNPIVEANFNCNEPASQNTFDVNIISSLEGSDLTGLTYKVFRDDGVLVDGFAQYNVDTDTDLIFETTNSFEMTKGTKKEDLNKPITYSEANLNRSLWVVLYVPALDQFVIDEADFVCNTLPVKFISFGAGRTGKMVKVEWKTAQEWGCAGFEIQRISQSGIVETIGKMNSKAVNGNSNYELSYSFDHLNASSAPYQYRVKQLDINGRQEFSQLRKVNGLHGVQTAYVYPNPVVGGRLKVYFDDVVTERIVSLIDNTGRLVKQINSKNVNQVEISVSNVGIYHLKVFIPTSGKTMLQKVVVN